MFELEDGRELRLWAGKAKDEPSELPSASVDAEVLGALGVRAQQVRCWHAQPSGGENGTTAARPGNGAPSGGVDEDEPSDAGDRSGSSGARPQGFDAREIELPAVPMSPDRTRPAPSRHRLFPPSVLIDPATQLHARLGTAGAVHRVRLGQSGRQVHTHERVGLGALDTDDEPLQRALDELGLRVAAVPRKLPGDSRAEKLVLVEQLVREVWDLAGRMPVSPPKRMVDHLHLATGHAAERAPFHTLMLLGDLLDRGGVRDAWAALLADPVHRLRVEHPVLPSARARRPVAHGARGPWTLRDGWSPDNRGGRVTDRRVYREIDTPPNRLALRLAHEVRHLADDVLTALETLQQPADQRYSVAMTEIWRERARNYRDTAARVLAFPDFADVNARGELALESPSVQLNARCRPLLNAWVRLHEGIKIDADLERALHDPIANAPQLWEHWCFAQVVLALQALGWDGNIEIVAPLKAPQSPPTSDWFGAAVPGPRNVRMTHHAGAGAIWLWWASGCLPGNEDRVGGKWELPVQAYSDERFVPDILLLREAEPIVPESLHLLAVLDAKFSRSLSGDSAGERSPWMQAHAYRDALRGKKQEDPAPPWSVLLHLGEEGKLTLYVAPGPIEARRTGVGSLALSLGTGSAQRDLVELLAQVGLPATESANLKSA